jgi:hypothetical protein
MTNDPRDMKEIWQTQPAGTAALSPEAIRRKARGFRGTVLRRNLREYAVTLLLVVFFGWFTWKSPDPRMRVGNALSVAGLVYMAWQLHRRASAKAAPADWAALSCREFHRSQLARQRDALRGVWRWYLGPLVPGLGVIAVAGGMAGFERSTVAGLLVVLFTIPAAALLWWVGRLNLRAAGKLQEQIDALDAE